MASSSSSPKKTRNPGKGRRKIEIKKMEQTSKRLVTFSKRKLGLFRKAAELSLLCDSQIAVIVFSQFGKAFSSGYPDPDAVIRRYLSGTASSSSFSDPTPVHDLERESAPLRREFEEAMKVLEEEKKFVNAKTGWSGCGHGLWWNRSVEEMGLEEVVQFKECVEQLRQDVAAAAEEKKKSSWLIDSQSPPVVTTAEEKNSTWLIDLQSPPVMYTAEEKNSTWLIDSQSPPVVNTAEEKLIDSQSLPMTTVEEKKSTWLIDSQLPLPPVTTAEEKKCTWLIDSQSPPVVTTAEEKNSTWLIDLQSPPVMYTAEEENSTWLIDSKSPPVVNAAEEKLIDSQSLPMTTVEEKKSTWLIHSQLPLPPVTTAEEKKCTWLIDTQSPPWSTEDQSMYLSMFDDMLEIDQSWESWNASNSCDSIVPYSSDLGQNWPLTLRN
ncbi:hypothetical protein K1719_009218 [Acacia pycnantha]|nr:hypothetical protein K1719_009218 [Acacia pycnantha]